MLVRTESAFQSQYLWDTGADPAPVLHRLDLGILIVNEDMRSAGSLSRALLDLGYHTIYTAYSGRRALDVVVMQSPSVVLVDLELPDMTGFQLAARFRAHASPAVRKVPMVAIAELPRFANAELARAAGFMGCLTKPVDRLALNAYLSQLQPGVLS